MIALIALFLPSKAAAVELITNGGFETGNFTGWTATNPSGPFESWAVTGSGAGYTDSPVPLATSVIVGTRNASHGVTASPAGSFLLVQQVTIPSGNSVQFRWRHRYQMNLSTYCNSAATCGTATFAVEILNTSNVLLQTLYTISTTANTSTNTGWTLNNVNLTAYAGSTIRIRFRTNVTVALAGPGRLEIDDVSVNAFVPTAAESTIAGRVLDNNGRPISRVMITVTDAAGASRTVASNNFGYYNLPGLNAGETYTLTAQHKRFLFPDSPRVLNLQDNVNELNFVASPSIERMTFF